MQKLNNSRSSRLFLIELIIAILFFSLGSAVCVQAFVGAHNASTQARDLAFASSTVSSAASVLRYTGGDAASFQEYFPGAREDDNGVLFTCYAGDFSPCGEEEAAYVLRAETRAEEAARRSHISMFDAGGELLYELELLWPAGD